MGRWLRIPTDFYQTPALWQLPDDSARFGWLGVLGSAKASDTPGRFASRDHFLASVPWRAAANLDAYLAAGLLNINESGQVVVSDWSGQNDPTAAERQARRREQVPEYTPFPEEPRAEADDAYTRIALLAEQLTGRPYVIADQHGKMGQKVADLIARHGEQKVADTFRLIAQTLGPGPGPTISQLVFGAGNALDPVPAIKVAAAKSHSGPEPKRRCSVCLGSGIIPLDLLPNGGWEPDVPGCPPGMKFCDCQRGVA